ncbi:MAG: hypothetical protein ACO396_02350, partial [Phycisphaerales bacterium]
ALAAAMPSYASADAPAPREPEPWTLGVVGASASAGFGAFVQRSGTEGPPVQGVDLADLVSTLAPPGTVVSDWSTSMLFHDPCTIAPRALERLLGQRPDAILAIDFLFWFAYGAFDAKGERIVEESQRDALFEFGLSLLDSIEVPILVGDLPDVRGANPRMLSRWQVPSVETLERLNARLRAWAEARPHVRIFPLAERTRIALEDRGPPTNAPGTGGPREDPIESGKDSASSEPPGAPLIQRDRLHPTFEGLVLMTDAAIRAMQDVPAFASLGDALDSDDPRPLADRLRARILGEKAIPATAP